MLKISLVLIILYSKLPYFQGIINVREEKKEGQEQIPRLLLALPLARCT